VAARFGRRRGDRMQYIDGLIDVIALLEEEGVTEPVVIHTDQGSVYASMAYNELIKDKNIKRSMSRPGKPTDNPVNESLNGWIKEELFIEFPQYNKRYCRHWGCGTEETIVPTLTRPLF